MLRRLRSLILLLICSLLVAGCGSDTETGSSGNSDVSVDEILSAASARMAETQSMRFALEVEGETYVDATRTIQLLAARGNLARPNKVAVDFQVELFGTGTVTIKMITVGPDSWTTDLLTGEWGTAPPEFGYNPSVLFDNQQGLGPVMGRLQNPVLQGREEIDGREVYKVSGTASAATMGSLTSTTMSGDPIGLDLWIDTETSDLVRVVVREPENSGKDQPAVWTMRLTDHDEQVSIDPPT